MVVNNIEIFQKMKNKDQLVEYRKKKKKEKDTSLIIKN